MAAVEKICPDARGVLLIPENHTRNTFYLQNVAALQKILRHAGMNVRIGSLLPELTAPTEIELPNGGKLTLEPLKRSGNRIGVEGFDPCVVLLNNDLSAGVPTSCAISSSPCCRRCTPAGSRAANRTISRPTATWRPNSPQLIGIDPWLINPYFEKCGKINFQERKGEECLEGYVSEILDDIRAKYKEYGIKQEPFVIVKADAGTYGMGIMTVKDPSEVRGLNRKQRNKMAVVKEGLEVHEVLVQEGVYTFESVNDAVAEPVVYMIDHFVVGGFYRVHTERGTDQNLNAPGMQFVAARIRGALLVARSRRSGLSAQPFLCLRRDRAPRAGRRRDRTRADRSGCADNNRRTPNANGEPQPLFRFLSPTAH